MPVMTSDAGGNRKHVAADGFGSGNLHHFWDTEWVRRLGDDPRRIAGVIVAGISDQQRQAGVAGDGSGLGDGFIRCRPQGRLWAATGAEHEGCLCPQWAVCRGGDPGCSAAAWPGRRAACAGPGLGAWRRGDHAYEAAGHISRRTVRASGCVYGFGPKRVLFLDTYP